MLQNYERHVKAIGFNIDQNHARFVENNINQPVQVNAFA